MILTSLLESWPIQLNKHSSHTGVSKVVIVYKSGSVALYHFELVDVTQQMGGPDSTSVFKDGSNVCHIAARFNSRCTMSQISLKESFD